MPPQGLPRMTGSDPLIIKFPLCRKFTSEGITVSIEIFRIAFHICLTKLGRWRSSWQNALVLDLQQPSAFWKTLVKPLNAGSIR